MASPSFTQLIDHGHLDAALSNAVDHFEMIYSHNRMRVMDSAVLLCVEVFLFSFLLLSTSTYNSS